MDLWKTKVAGHGRTITIGRAKKFSMGHGLSAQIVKSVWLIKRSWSNRNHRSAKDHTDPWGLIKRSWSNRNHRSAKEQHGDHLSTTKQRMKKEFLQIKEMATQKIK